MADTPVTAATRLVVRGARTHNLKSVDVSLPLGRLVIITGVSGSGKSSLAFDTIYAEGQRRYVESLSAYARQFLERMEKPDVDRIEGICPAIAIRQKNSIRNPRSTVGTTTEIHDYMRLLWARVGRTICRQCGQEVVRETAEVVARRLNDLPPGSRLLIGFDMPVVAVPDAIPVADLDEGESPESQDDRLPLGTPEGASKRERAPAPPDAISATIDSLAKRGFRRLLVDDRAVTLEDLDRVSLAGRTMLQVIVDRVQIDGDLRARLTDSIETAYAEGGGAAFAVEISRDDARPLARHVFSERFECRRCGIAYEDPQPRLFSFNNPFGACATCHGFGNVIELDMDLVVPDGTKSLRQGAVEPWTKPHYKTQLADLKRAAKKFDIPLDVPWQDLTPEHKRLVIEGDGLEFDGIRGFFRWLERKKYKVHVRVFLSRYRGYLTCPDCEGARLRREARDVRVGGQTIDRVAALTVSDVQRFFAELSLGEQDAAVAEKVLREIRRRLAFLGDVGLDYLTLDRLSSTLSGGESQRINLATSLGSALVDTLYVLDEPSVGLHPRDNLRLIAILRQLRDQGNTVLVVEHDADMIAVADYLVDLGLGAGEQGGRIVFAGTLPELMTDPRSLTAKYLRHELTIPLPAVRRRGTGQQLRILGATEHNLKNVDIAIPLNALTCVTGVSGSGKSTLVHDVVYGAVKRRRAASGRRAGAYRSHAGNRVSDGHGAGGPDAHRPDAAIEPGHLPEGVRSDSRVVCGHQGRA